MSVLFAMNRYSLKDGMLNLSQLDDVVQIVKLIMLFQLGLWRSNYFINRLTRKTLMYRIYLINHPHPSSVFMNDYSTFNTAFEAGKKTCFEFSIYKETSYVGHWSPINGWNSGYRLKDLTNEN